MQLVATLDEYGKPAWITAMIVGFLSVVARRPWRFGLSDLEWTHGMRILEA